MSGPAFEARVRSFEEIKGSIGALLKERDPQ
jgi:hypothetical protein